MVAQTTFTETLLRFQTGRAQFIYAKRFDTCKFYLCDQLCAIDISSDQDISGQICACWREAKQRRDLN